MLLNKTQLSHIYECTAIKYQTRFEITVFSSGSRCNLTGDANFSVSGFSKLTFCVVEAAINWRIFVATFIPTVTTNSTLPVTKSVMLSFYPLIPAA